MSGSLPLGRRIDLVIFDCDGVLIDSEVIAIQCLIECLAPIGWELDFETAADRFVGKNWLAIQESLEADLGRKLSADFVADVDRRSITAMAERLQPIPGIGDALERLALPRCVASGSPIDWIERGLDKTELRHHFDDRLFSASMVENGKPAPDVFLFAAASMGVSPEQALVVEDSLPGVQAGVAAGMTVVGFTGGSHIVDAETHGARLEAEGAALVIDDMARLGDVIGRTKPGASIDRSTQKTGKT